MERGAVWWAQLPEPIASEFGFRRPIILFNQMHSAEVVFERLSPLSSPPIYALPKRLVTF